MTTDFEDSTRERRIRTLRTRAARRRTQQLVGLLLLMAGYICLAIHSDSASDWLLLRVAAGFMLLFAGFAVAIGPTVSSLLSGHD